MDLARASPQFLPLSGVDFAILAEGPLDIGPRVRLVGAAPFLCSGGVVGMVGAPSGVVQGLFGLQQLIKDGSGVVQPSN